LGQAKKKVSSSDGKFFFLLLLRSARLAGAASMESRREQGCQIVIGAAYQNGKTIYQTTIK
jgi:hypothetical protein